MLLLSTWKHENLARTWKHINNDSTWILASDKRCSPEELMFFISVFVSWANCPVQLSSWAPLPTVRVHKKQLLPSSNLTFYFHLESQKYAQAKPQYFPPFETVCVALFHPYLQSPFKIQYSNHSTNFPNVHTHHLLGKWRIYSICLWSLMIEIKIAPWTSVHEYCLSHLTKRDSRIRITVAISADLKDWTWLFSSKILFEIKNEYFQI